MDKQVLHFREGVMLYVFNEPVIMLWPSVKATCFLFSILDFFFFLLLCLEAQLFTSLLSTPHLPLLFTVFLSCN